MRDGLSPRLRKQHEQLAAAAKGERWEQVGTLRESSRALCEQIEAIRLPGKEAKIGYREQALTLAEAVEVANQIAGRHRAAANDLNSQMKSIKGPKAGQKKRVQQNAAQLQQLLDQYNRECYAIVAAHDGLAPLRAQYTDLQNRHPTKVKEDKRVHRFMREEDRPKPRLVP